MEIREKVNSFTSSFRSSLGDDFEGSIKEENDRNEDEVELQWAAIEKLPTFKRLRTSLFDNEDLNNNELEEGKSMIDVAKLGDLERHVFIEKLVKDIEEDNRRLLRKLKERIDRVGVKLPSIEVRYQNLSIEAECEVVQGKPLPTIWNTLKSFFSGITQIACCKSQSHKLVIIKDVSGIIKPSRMTLLLGPPGCGKTTLLQALAGNLDSSLKTSGDIDYNGYKLNDFVPQKTAAYISQSDLHISELTVRETLDFSARCQGIGPRADILREVSRREKKDGIFPDPDIDTFMKAISIKGLRRTMQTDYILKILGLDICADTIVGDALRRGISGGQKKRLTTGEMIIGPTKALFMDEISNGLDSSTTFQIVTCLQQLAHIADSTILVSLLQPAPETFDLFDDVILMAEGKVVYHGPRENVLDFFHRCGFRCPSRKGIADFLQEVVSKKDQEKYWNNKDGQSYGYISVDEFRDMFKDFHVGKKLEEELSKPFEKSQLHRDALSFSVRSLRKWDLLRACISREWLLMKRNSFVYVFTSAQLAVIAAITMTVFLRTRMSTSDVVGANYFMGSLFYALIRLMCNGYSELAMTVSRLTVFYKHKDFYFFPSWAYSIPATIVKIPLSLLDAFLWTTLTYYAIGYSPEPERFFKQLFLLFLVHQVSISQFRLIASVVRNPSVAANSSLFILVLLFLFSGFVIPKPSLPGWIQWGFWLSPMAYAEIGISVNEFLAPRWQKVSSSNVTVGHQVLKNRGLDFGDHFYWITIGALFGFWIVFNIGFTCALSYLKPPGRSRAIISQKKLSNLKETERLRSLNEEKEMKPCFRTALALEETTTKTKSM